MASLMEVQVPLLGMGTTMGALALALVVVVVVHVAVNAFGRRRLPPSPASLPVIGHLHLLRPPVHRTFHELAARLGPLMHVRLGSTHCVVASSAEVAAELIRSHEAKISERPLTAVARQFAYESAGFAFAPYSPHWRFMKRLCMSELLGPRTVEQLRPVRRAGLVSLLRHVLSQPEAEAVDLTRELIRMSNTSIIRMAASTVPSSVTEEAQELVKVVAELVGAFNADDYIALCRGWDLQGLGRRAADVHKRFDALLEEMIRPERFLAGGGGEGVEPRGQHFQFMPFGSGRRGCPGMGLALQSVPAVVAALLQCFDWQCMDNKLIDMEEADGLVCARKHRLLLHAHPRLHPFPPLL
ncbi:hypothetical protein DAI22_04g000300 [Oryza sativa Japonica Group]|nr:hypothetical protein DAI22_04g000300 [Oryza sativa Japonica Group]